MLKLALKLILFLIIFAALFLGGILLYSTITKYNPETFITLEKSGEPNMKQLPDTFSILIWNIGYCGLNEDMDFFNDGGKSVRASQVVTEENMRAISSFLSKKAENVDFILLQEVDINSKRTYYTNQHEFLTQSLPEFESCFALNYNVKFVPVPFGIPYRPYGKTYGGLLNFNKYNSLSSLRVQYPGGFAWPTSLFMLNRCALEQTFELQNGKKLMIVNTHNTAYDQTGEIKKKEMEFMCNRYDSLSNAGFQIIIGGDWNQIPTNFDPKKFNANLAPGYTPHGIGEDMIPMNWMVVYDENLPTNRSNKTPYVEGQSYTTLIDFFMVSPEIEILSVETIKMEFKYSDHEPVLLKVKVN
jgi:endonuclease/exonuclease/phosphatase family metal-dependent hydrolase